MSRYLSCVFPTFDTVESMAHPETFLWHIWPARHWPCAVHEEARFLADLESDAGLAPGKIITHERGDLTTVLNALRNGMSYADLHVVAPGVVPRRLLSAYRHIDKLRVSSLEAFAELLKKPTAHSVHTSANLAAQLLPVPTYHLVAAISDSPTKARATVRQIRANVATAVSTAAEFEDRLVAGILEADESVRIGKVLYDPFAGGVWSHPYYTPPRVGTLVPDRVRDLLGEQDG